MIEYRFEAFEVDLDQDYIQREFVVFGGKMQTIIRRGMRNTPKTGRRYKRGRKTHIASSPGNYPAVDTSRLLGSIDFDVRPGLLEVGASASAGVNYAKFVDPTRPFLDRGFRDTLKQNPDFMSDFLIIRNV